MIQTNPFGARSTADQVLAGVDLHGKRFVVTGCNSGIGFEILQALAANGAEVVGLARTLSAAQAACAKASRSCIPLECDLSDLDSVAAAAAALRAHGAPLDAIIANAGIAWLPALQTKYGVEMQFLVNHVGHFALVNPLSDLVRDGSGRIVVVTGNPRLPNSPADGLLFENLDARRGYHAQAFYAQSKWALAVYAKELSRRLHSRGIAVNAVDPGVTKGTAFGRHGRRPLLARWFGKNAQRAAATPALLAASPRVIGRSGELWTNCRAVDTDARLDEVEVAARLWRASERILAAHAPATTGESPKPMQAAA